MTKAALIAKVAAQMQLSKKQTDVIIALFFTGITDALSEGDNVELRGFGSFRVRHRPPRKGRNPKTGAPVSIPAKCVPFFKAGKDLRELVDAQ